MIDNSILDKIFSEPDRDTLKDELVAKLQERGFVITNFRSGGIFYTMLMIVVQVRVELTKLLRSMLNTMYVRHADGEWLGMLAADFSKTRKAAVKAQGTVTLYRDSEAEITTVVPRGTVFLTETDINGEKLRFFSIEKVTGQKGTVVMYGPVEAEMEGSKYNIPPGQITKSMKHLEGVERINNDEGWISREGSDIEEWESLRERTLGAWDLLATMPTAAKYKNICEAVDGVLHVTVHQLHPRGQGTVDIIVTGTAGEATPELLAKVQAAADGIKAPDDDVLVKSAITVTQDIMLQVILPKLVSDDGIKDRVVSVVTNYFRISRDRELNEFIQYNLLYAIKNSVPLIKNVKIIEPEGDLVLEKDKVIICGTVTVNIEREE